MHPTDRTLTIRIDPVTREWYPAARIGKLMDKVVSGRGGIMGSSRMTCIPRSSCSG